MIVEPTPQKSAPALGRAVIARLRGVHKTYGPVRVLDLPELDLYAGEVVGVVGENGAGKSTLMGTLAGSVRREGGEIEIEGHALPPGSTAESARLGVALVSQEFPLVGQLSVAENLLLGRRPTGSRRRVLVDGPAQRRAAEAMLTAIGLAPGAIPVRRQVRSLPVPARQLIEIAKGWGRAPRLLILDEPTSSLGPVEARLVLDLARRAADQGSSVLFIGHRLDEVREVSDRIVVLRNGRLVADLAPDEATEERLIREMVGAEVAHSAPKTFSTANPVLLSIEGLTAEGLGPVDLTVREGEILGIAGLMGSGRSRLIHTVAGAQPSTGGSMHLSGKAYAPRRPGDGTDAGIAMIPEDRKLQSLVLFAPIKENVTLGILRRISSRGVVGPRKVRGEAKAITANVKVRMQSVDQPIGSLSGGNQQRAIFGRAFSTSPRLLLLDEPTRGVDVGAKAEIYELIDRTVAQGTAVVAASSELEELLWICHRIAVMHRGRVAAVFDRADATKENIMTAAATGAAPILPASRANGSTS
ncbi:sugar ABC transporter ATP-binding protein [Actinospica durhamensis]|uniref:Sugar ABC transporter ATP-binding protein n=1 Tax=Actinospica durhamensis TaxID=1508375 RepID=A0A941ENB4_9ACTN|nr:sugar ABC transporter ATP-binding protein [Actinospica durhamensis]MBR7834406.1 sugar ABC transporter ATP-binding protein [Actinospica durhamensis]